MWATGDAQKGWLEKPPIDPQRKSAHDEKLAAAAIDAKNMGCATMGIAGCVVGALFTMGISLLGLLIFIPMILSAKKHNAQLAQAKADLESFEAELPETVRRFRSNKKSLRGIYEGEVTGDAGAF